MKLIFLFTVICLFQLIFTSNPCSLINVKSFEPKEIIFNSDLDNSPCVYFPFENYYKGNIILKLQKSNSFSSLVYIYENESEINFDEKEKDFKNYLLKMNIGKDIFKEKKLEEMKKLKYFFIIYEHSYKFSDVLTIYNDNFTEGNYYELYDIIINNSLLLNYKYPYSKSNPIIIHFNNKNDNGIKYLKYQFSSLANNTLSMFIYENKIEENNIIEEIMDKEENSNIINLKSEKDYYIKIINQNEIQLIFDFLSNKFINIINPTYQQNFITNSEHYYYISKETKDNNTMNEITIKFDRTNLYDLPMKLLINKCSKNTDEELDKCLTIIPKESVGVIKRDSKVPYIYHIYYSFENENFIVFNIQIEVEHLEVYQAFRLDNTPSFTNIDNKESEFKIFDVLTYLHPQYFKVNLNSLQNEKFKIVLYINDTSTTQIFFGNNMMTPSMIDTKPDLVMEDKILVLDSDDKDLMNLLRDNKYIMVMIYSPWLLAPLHFEVLFMDNIYYQFYYLKGNNRPFDSPIKIQLNSPLQKFYLFGKYNSISEDIIFNEVIYGKINSLSKRISEGHLSEILFDKSVGEKLDIWKILNDKIDIIEITCSTPSLAYIHFVNKSFDYSGDNTLNEGIQKWIYMKKGSGIVFHFSEHFQFSGSLNLEVVVVSKKEEQEIKIEINNEEYSIDSNIDSHIFRYYLENPQEKIIKLNGTGEESLLRLTIGLPNSTSSEKLLDDISYIKEYNISNKFLSKKMINKITNKNNENAVICYSSNFAKYKLLYFPINENCFVLSGGQTVNIDIFNPFNKYLENDNKLFSVNDSYYFFSQVIDKDLEKNIEFSSSEELMADYIDIDSKEITGINPSKQGIKPIKLQTLEKENYKLFIQISITNSVKEKLISEENSYKLKLSTDSIIKEGKISSDEKRLFILTNDPLVDSYLEFNTNKNYEIKYILSKIENYNFIINQNYSLEFLEKSKNKYSIKFRPLIKNESIKYNLFFSFNNNNDFSSIINLKDKLSNKGGDIIIYSLDKNSNADFIELELPEEITEQINKRKNDPWKINILAEQKDNYELIMNYDTLKYKSREKENERKLKIIIMTVSIILMAAIIIIIIILCFLKKKRKADEELEKINPFAVSMGEQKEGESDGEGDEKKKELLY